MEGAAKTGWLCLCVCVCVCVCVCGCTVQEDGKRKINFNFFRQLRILFSPPKTLFFPVCIVGSRVQRAVNEREGINILARGDRKTEREREREREREKLLAT